MKKLELQKHKFDEKMRLAIFVALLLFAGFLELSHSPLSGEVVTLIVGLAGGNALAK